MIYFYQSRHCGRFIWVDRVLIPDDRFNLPLIKNMKGSYTYIMQDVNDAIAGFPETAETGHFTKNTASVLKSEICLTAAAYFGANGLDEKNLYE